MQDQVEAQALYGCSDRFRTPSLQSSSKVTPLDFSGRDHHAHLHTSRVKCPLNITDTQKISPMPPSAQPTACCLFLSILEHPLKPSPFPALYWDYIFSLKKEKVFLAALHGMWDPSSLTRDWTCAPLQWKHGDLASRLPGKSQEYTLLPSLAALLYSVCDNDSKSVNYQNLQIRNPNMNQHCGARSFLKSISVMCISLSSR